MREGGSGLFECLALQGGGAGGARGQTGARACPARRTLRAHAAPLGMLVAVQLAAHRIGALVDWGEGVEVRGIVACSRAVSHTCLSPLAKALPHSWHEKQSA